MKRLLASALVAAVAISAYAGGGRESAAPGRKIVTVWTHSGKPEERSVMEQMVADFNAVQSEYEVQVTMLPEGSYNEQVSAAALAGKLPDLLDFDGPNLYNYAWSGHLVPLDQFIPDSLRQDLLPSIISQGTYNGKVYALGVFDSGLSLWANKAYLKKAGIRIPEGVQDRWSFAEFNDALAKLQALPEVEHAIDFKMNYGQGEWYTYGFSPFIQSFGADLIDRKGFKKSSGTINGDDAVAAMTWFQSLFEKGYADAAPAGDESFYVKKSSALAFVGHWMKEPHMKGLGDDLALLPMPVIGAKAVTGMGSWCWGITSGGKNQQGAWKFLEYMMSSNNILLMTNANGAVPARFSALDRSPLYGSEGMLRVFRDQLETIAVARPQTPAYPTITVAFAEAVQNIVNGSDVRSELDKAAAKIDQDIADNKGYPVRN